MLSVTTSNLCDSLQRHGTSAVIESKAKHTFWLTATLRLYVIVSHHLVSHEYFHNRSSLSGKMMYTRIQSNAVLQSIKTKASKETSEFTVTIRIDHQSLKRHTSLYPFTENWTIEYLLYRILHHKFTSYAASTNLLPSML